MSDLRQAIEAAGGYEDLLVPALFRDWAPRVAEAVAPEPHHRVLDVACGTGVLARELAGRVQPPGGVTGLDPNPGMLAVAARLAPDLEWREGTAEALPFADGAFERVASQFGLMFFADRERAVREMARVLAAGGRAAVAVWDRLERNPAYADEVELLERVAGRPAADAVRAPFALGDPDALAALFEGAGFDAVEVRTERGEGAFPSVTSMVGADLHGWLPVMGVHLEAPKIREVLELAEEALGGYASGDGGIRFETSAHIVVAGRR